MKNRIIVLLSVMTLSACLLAGCGSSKATDSADSTEATASTENTESTDNADTAEDTVTAPVIEDLSSYDAIISQLTSGQAYAFADMDPDNDALLVTSYTYDNGDGNIAAIDATVYGFDSEGNIMEYGTVESIGTAYPLAVSDQCLMYGGGHYLFKTQIDESVGSLMTVEYASETFDEDGNATYSYMSLADGEESIPEDNSKLEAMFDEYNNSAVVINFTVVE